MEIIDREQEPGPGRVSIPKAKIIEIGNFYAGLPVIPEPDDE